MSKDWLLCDSGSLLLRERDFPNLFAFRVTGFGMSCESTTSKVSCLERSLNNELLYPDILLFSLCFLENVSDLLKDLFKERIPDLLKSPSESYIGVNSMRKFGTVPERTCKDVGLLFVFSCRLCSVFSCWASSAA